MKKTIIYACLCIALFFSGCAISVNTTKHSEQPWVGNQFDLSRTDYQVVRPVTYEFRATYVLGIGGWKSRRENAVDKLCEMADLSRNQQVVNITYRTFVNCILGPLVIRRETEAKGLLIEMLNDGNTQSQLPLTNVSPSKKALEGSTNHTYAEKVPKTHQPHIWSLPWETNSSKSPLSDSDIKPQEVKNKSKRPSEQELKDAHTRLLDSAIVQIPDANFKNYLLKKYDSNSDGELSRHEALRILMITLRPQQQIKDITGIEACKNVTSFSSKGNKFSKVDLSSLRYLESVWISPDCVDTLILPRKKHITVNLPENKIQYK